MISDDVVWLGYAVNHYIAVTGDQTILKENLPFIDGQPLHEGEHDSFFTPETSKKSVSLYEHCARALDLAVKRSSPAGLYSYTGESDSGLIVRQSKRSGSSYRFSPTIHPRLPGRPGRQCQKYRLSHLSWHQQSLRKCLVPRS